MEFFSFIDQSHSLNYKKIDKQVSPVLIILKLSYFTKNDSKKLKFWFWFVGLRK